MNIIRAAILLVALALNFQLFSKDLEIVVGTHLRDQVLRFVWCPPSKSEYWGSECAKGFWIMATEMPLDEFSALFGPGIAYTSGNLSWSSDYPIDNLSVEDCQLVINKLNRHCNLHFYLPSVSQWRWACSGAVENARVYPQDVYDMAWCRGNSRGKVHHVAGKKSNGLGISDMLGNVEEWCRLDSATKEDLLTNQNATLIGGGCHADASYLSSMINPRERVYMREPWQRGGLRLCVELSGDLNKDGGRLNIWECRTLGTRKSVPCDQNKLTYHRLGISDEQFEGRGCSCPLLDINHLGVDVTLLNENSAVRIEDVARLHARFLKVSRSVLQLQELHRKRNSLDLEPGWKASESLGRDERDAMFNAIRLCNNISNDVCFWDDVVNGRPVGSRKFKTYMDLLSVSQFRIGAAVARNKGKLKALPAEGHQKND